MDRAAHRLLPSVTSVLLFFLLLPSRASSSPRLLRDLKEEAVWEPVTFTLATAVEDQALDNNDPAEGPTSSFESDQGVGDLVEDEIVEISESMPKNDEPDVDVDIPEINVPSPWLDQPYLELAKNNDSGAPYFGPMAIILLIIAAVAVGLFSGALGGLFFLRSLRKK